LSLPVIKGLALVTKNNYQNLFVSYFYSSGIKNYLTIKRGKTYTQENPLYRLPITQYSQEVLFIYLFFG